jgi:hypothetical protein
MGIVERIGVFPEYVHGCVFGRVTGSGKVWRDERNRLFQAEITVLTVCVACA